MEAGEGGYNPRTRRWILIAFGIAFLYGAWHLYSEFAAMEAAGGSMRINWLFAGIYKAVGKWGVALVFVGLGLFFLYGAFSPPAEATGDDK